ncbi:MAG: MerR family transcriptional regulator [Anaerolineales bacterium]|nr:MerR family transcriptional regulator [Anaerolineales bacterium]
MHDKQQFYTVQRLANIAGVTVRTLHHYDRIGLLQPAERSPAGYRRYGHEDLLRLQQILFYRELDFPLADIKDIIEGSGFNPVAALEQHRRLIQGRIGRLEKLLTTIDRTINQYLEARMLTDKDLYEGFATEEIERMKREARKSYGSEEVEQTENRLKKMSKEQWKGIQAQGGEVTLRIAGLMDRDPSEAEVQEAIAGHHAWIENFYSASAELYRGLGQMYVEHDEFRAFYEQIKEGLAEFMCAAMTYYADHTLRI